ncbi:MAG: 30S ribosomal protein S6--L-glutamate ligase [Planctomycetaceae bacterium]|nr:30S ribosomal protein S6--L-glutamate ligase [Planctomycetaceae bacterium]
MEIAILSRGENLYSTRRLVEAAEERGHEPEVIDYLRCMMDISATKPTVRFMGRTLEEFDAVIPRIGASKTFYGAAVVRQFEMMSTFVTSRAQAITNSRDKLRSMQMLARNGVDMPVTGFAHSTKDIAGLLEQVGGTPVVVKLLEGTQGIGVILAEHRKAAEAVIEAFMVLDANILVQEFIKEADASDIRCFVVGDRVVAAMKRVGEPGEYRSNLHRGGTAEAVKLTAEMERVALAATKAVGLSIAGVDLLPSKRGPLVMEVNSSPGLEGVESATDVDVAGEIIEFVERSTGKGFGSI